MYSAWRMARATIVNVGFSAVLVVNRLPSEMNKSRTRRDDPLAFWADDFRLTGTVEEVHGFFVMSTQGTGNGRVSW